MNYATSLNRFLAAFIDAVIVGIVSSILGSIVGQAGGGSRPWINFISLIYYVVMTYYYGATLGKKALGIKVVDASGGNKLSFGQVILRELVGKFVSAIVILLGFIWILFDAKKQGWHDKIANTVVIKV